MTTADNVRDPPEAPPGDEPAGDSAEDFAPARPRKKPRRPRVADADVRRAWQSSASIPEACERTGLAPHALVRRAERIRERGVRLKHLPREQQWKGYRRLTG